MEHNWSLKKRQMDTATEAVTSIRSLQMHLCTKKKAKKRKETSLYPSTTARKIAALQHAGRWRVALRLASPSIMPAHNTSDYQYTR